MSTHRILNGVRELGRGAWRLLSIFPKPVRWAVGGLVAVLGWLGAEKLRARLSPLRYPPRAPSRPPVPLSTVRAKTRATRAERYSSKAKAEIAEANREARRREQITQPNRGDWAELKRINEALNKKDEQQ